MNHQIAQICPSTMCPPHRQFELIRVAELVLFRVPRILLPLCGFQAKAVSVL